MLKLHIGAILVFGFLGLHLFSQEPGTPIGLPNDLDQQYVPDKNSILNSVNNSTASSGGSESSIIKNVIKFNVSLLSRSTAAFFWEHSVSKAISLEGGVGGCFGVDYMQKMFSELGDGYGGNNNNNKLMLSKLLQNSTYAGSPSPFLSAGARFYFANDAPEGAYFSFSVRYASYNMTYNQDANNGMVVSGDPNFFVKNLGFNFLYGFQSSSDSWSRGGFVQDVFMGISIRKTSYTGFYFPSSNSSGGQPITLNRGADISQIQPVFLMGYSIGFGY